ncbi:histidinol-phosphate transaminase [Chitinophaga sp.]|uniref:pyridoxal phosphate-dependent aminotransferase n=1 Tax=Chitinophaga sp. TaxID=1869181 RepID=UPI0031E41B9B
MYRFYIPTIFFFIYLSGKAQQLSLNENPYPPAIDVQEAIKKEIANIARYPGPDANALITAIAQKEGVGEDQIIPGEVLGQLGVYLGLKGGEFIYSVPGYPVFTDAAASVGGKVIAVPLNEKKENDLDQISKSINAHTTAIFLVNPHNPSGTVSERRAFHDFLHTASKQAIILVDEAYLEYTDDFGGRTAVNNIKEGDNIIVFRTFAKAYGLAGLSIGYCVASPATAKFLKEKGLGNVHDLNRLSVVAAKAALADKNYIAALNKTITAEREKWNQLLDSLHLEHTTSQANFIYFNTGKPYEQVAAAFKAQGIQIGRLFSPYNTWIRITIGLPDENKKAQEVVRKL